jgi:hypothetical protein
VNLLLLHAGAYPVARLRAYMLRGFLRQRRGDAAGAKADWRLGWAEVKKVGAQFSLEGSLLGALADQITPADTEEIIDKVMGQVGRASPVAFLLRRKLLSPAFLAGVLRERWQSERGVEYARQIALRTLPYPDYYSIVYPLTLYAALHQGALPEKWSKEQEELVWKLSVDMLKAYSQTGKFTDGKAIPGLLTWTGMTGVLGWQGLASGLDKSLRGPLAYVMGHRMLRLGQPADAVPLFRTARDDAPPGSTLRKLAEAELARRKP